MEIKILQVFLGADGLPYKDQERTVHFPIVGSGFQGASNTTKIRFYYDELVEQDDTETAWVACAKLPNGKIGSKVLETDYDETLGEHYALLELDSFYFQYKGDVYISLQGYQGGVQVDYDEETELYTINGTPTIAATGSIKLSVNYATQFVGSGETSNVNFQRILADLGTKLGIRATSVYVEELPTVGNSDTFYVIHNDLSDPNKANIYIWNSVTEHYIWIGDNSLYLGDYYLKENGEKLEQEIEDTNSRIDELGGMYHYKGSKTVAQINALTGMTAGDAYNVTDSGTITTGGVSVVAGDNVAWTGTTWDKLSGTVDLTEYYTKDECDENFAPYDDVLESVTENEEIELTIQNDGYYGIWANFTSDTGRAYAIVTGVSAGEKYLLNTYLSSTVIPAILYMHDNSRLGYEKTGTGTGEVVTNYEFEIPTNCNKIIIQSSWSDYPPELFKIITQDKVRFYTKTESDIRYSKSGRKYGVRWKTNDNDDLGERCFDAEGLVATIGVGNTNGSSDFDNIYPWSEMKRCNIKVNTNGAYVVTYEGEDGFSLDGSNGDVFVRIPKFNILRYKENGYEYRVIGAENSPTHEAFIENGKELDEIFVGAFEGYIENGKLFSKSNVLPSSNETPQHFLDYAQERGEKYSLYDTRCVDAIWTLMAIEFGCRNTNAIIGYGLADFMQPVSGGRCVIIESSTNTNSLKVSHLTDDDLRLMPVGSNITICDTIQQNIIAQRKLLSITNNANDAVITFDGNPIDVTTSCFIGTAAFNTNFCENAPSGSLSWHTGRALWKTGTNEKIQNPIRYRWIENVVGNLWHYLPDVCFNNLQMYVCKNMKDYEFLSFDGTKYQPIGNLFLEQSSNGDKNDFPNYNYWITSLANETFAKPILFGRTYDTSLVSTKAFGGYYYLDMGQKAVANGGGFDHLWRCNMLTQRAWIDASTKWYLYGSRLIFKNID